jgi:hypothetical protein
MELAAVAVVGDWAAGRVKRRNTPRGVCWDGFLALTSQPYNLEPSINRSCNDMEAILFLVLVAGLFVLFKIRIEQNNEKRKK